MVIVRDDDEALIVDVTALRPDFTVEAFGLARNRPNPLRFQAIIDGVDSLEGLTSRPAPSGLLKAILELIRNDPFYTVRQVQLAEKAAARETVIHYNVDE